MHDLNPDIKITAIRQRLEKETLQEQIRLADVTIDASDNFATRYALNKACVEAGKPLVSGAAIRMEGQVALFPNNNPDSPCYRCLYRDGEGIQENCSENGVLAPLVGVIGSLQAAEAIKTVLNIGSTLDGRLLLVDLMGMEFRTIKLHKDPQCPVCKESNHEYKNSHA